MEEKYVNRLLKGWEETYKKGQLSFWILLSLREKPLFFEELKERITELTRDTISCEDQSLYRALRKFYDLEMVDYQMFKSERGPDKKQYHITDIGSEVLSRFIDRNILLLQSLPVQKILKKIKDHEKPK